MSKQDRPAAGELALDLPVGEGDRGLVAHLHQQMRTSIVSGRLAPGVRLLSTRAFAAQYAVSRNTACAVYDLLIAEGLLEVRRGAGTYVAHRSAEKTPTSPAPRLDVRLPRFPPDARLAVGASTPGPGDLDLRMGVVDQTLFPWEIWRRLTLRAIREHERKPSIFAPTPGLPALRAAIAGHVSFARAVACRPEDVIVTSGAQHAFDLLARTLVDPGATLVAVEEPGYPPARSAFLAAGARLAPVPVDDEGMIVEALPDDARIVFVTPSHQFPTGVPMSMARRRALIDVAGRRGLVVIEDDYDCEFRYGSRPLDALQTLDRTGSVVYVGTFSKTMFPGVRAGFVVAPAWLREALVATRRIAGFTGPTIQQIALTSFIAEGHLARHVRRMRSVYAQRRAALLAALESHGAGFLRPTPSAAGPHLTARLSEHLSIDDVMDAGASAGLVFERLDAYAMTQADPRAVGFGFGTTAAADLENAIARFAATVAHRSSHTRGTPISVASGPRSDAPTEALDVERAPLVRQSSQKASS